MKLIYQLILFALLINICLGSSQQQRQNCKNQHNVTDNDLAALPATATVADIPKNIKCFLKCVLQPLLIAENRNYDTDKEQKFMRCKEKYENVEDWSGCDYETNIFLCLDWL
ncbi:uncharacterized protein Dwil_GK28023 [Drosophila willistoni]|uniref:Uncharacterized protein n=1 Tax=Drosophila willistoni TaxID=7260 RepID=A0A0Q9X0Z9_DROWI|nr:uncharacterized protein LOC26530025 [Drosophila willistoni]KRF97602.1 uncharacterized protein Dwil_GK28023 [Drosophila willistoni]